MTPSRLSMLFLPLAIAASIADVPWDQRADVRACLDSHGGTECCDLVLCPEGCKHTDTGCVCPTSLYPELVDDPQWHCRGAEGDADDASELEELEARLDGVLVPYARRFVRSVLQRVSNWLDSRSPLQKFMLCWHFVMLGLNFVVMRRCFVALQFYRLGALTRPRLLFEFATSVLLICSAITSAPDFIDPKVAITVLSIMILKLLADDFFDPLLLDPAFRHAAKRQRRSPRPLADREWRPRRWPRARSSSMPPLEAPSLRVRSGRAYPGVRSFSSAGRLPCDIIEIDSD